MTNFFERIFGGFRRPPTHISLISDRWIFVSGNVYKLGSLASKVETMPNLYGAKGIMYSGEDELVLLLDKLNAAGVCFLEDFTQANCPCSVMNDLQDEGLVDGFSSISWKGYGLLKTMVLKRNSNKPASLASLN